MSYQAVSLSISTPGGTVKYHNALHCNGVEFDLQSIKKHYSSLRRESCGLLCLFTHISDVPEFFSRATGRYSNPSSMFLALLPGCNLRTPFLGYRYLIGNCLFTAAGPSLITRISFAMSGFPGRNAERCWLQVLREHHSGGPQAARALSDPAPAAAGDGVAGQGDPTPQDVRLLHPAGPHQPRPDPGVKLDPIQDSIQA